MIFNILTDMKTINTVKKQTPESHIVTLRIKGWAIKVDADDPDRSIFNIDHPLFKAVERYFLAWLDEEATEVTRAYYLYSQEGYYGQSAYSQRLAIEQGIWSLLSYAKENKLKVLSSRDWWKVDPEAEWQA